MACHMVANAGTIAQILLALFALLADVASAWGRYPSEAVRIRPNFLPPVGRVIVQDGKPASVTLEPIDLSIKLDARNYLSFRTPRYIVAGARGQVFKQLQPPALILDAICMNFTIKLTNRLPFQQYHTCPAAGGDAKFANGPKDFEWTNIHTHGLKVNPGAQTVENICEPGFPNAGFIGSTPTVSEYYCDVSTSSAQLCEVFADNIFVEDRPLAPGVNTPMYRILDPRASTLKYTYPLDEPVPGMGWYHPHAHGSVAIQTPTAAGPLIVPEGWLPNGLKDLYEPYGRRNAEACGRLLKIMEASPLEHSTILQINGIWFRNTTANTPDDDAIPFLGAAPAPPLRSILLYETAGNFSRPMLKNTAGRDWALVNGAFQPKITITANMYVRWELLNTMTMKWLDLTFQEVLPDGSLKLADTCSWSLLARDGVPLPCVPRLLQSTPANSSIHVSDLILGPANRADVLVKCERPGTYLLASGAGPFHTNYDACQAPHCECFGDAPANGAPLRPANNLYGGRELNAAVLAVVNVAPLNSGMKADADIPDNVCRSRLERFTYLDYPNFPTKTEQQCVSFMNQAFGGACSINNVLFPDYVTYMEQGTQQRWRLRDITFHPFHLHETPVRLTKLPQCATSVTNNWKVGDWLDSLLLPTCQTGCSWPLSGSGGGVCGSRINVCDEAEVQFLATFFRDTKPMCRAIGLSSPVAEPKACEERVSVYHCHVLSHEDEGCMSLLVWYCPENPPAARNLARCPNSYPPCPSPPAASAASQQTRPAPPPAKQRTPRS